MRHLTPSRFALSLAALLALLLASVLFGLGVGPSWIPPDRVLAALTGSDVDGALADIVLGIRLPRVLLAALVGASLSTAGVIFQALLRNPLADPFILGVSGGAALGRDCGPIARRLRSAWGYRAVPPAAFAGCDRWRRSLLYLPSAGQRQLACIGRLGLLLTGVVVFNSFASAAIVFLASLAGLCRGAAGSSSG